MEVVREKRARQDSISDQSSTRPLKAQAVGKQYINISADGNSRQHNGDVIHHNILNLQYGDSERSNKEWRLRQVLDSLRFPDMDARRNAIPFAADHTFEWLLKSDQKGADNGSRGFKHYGMLQDSLSLDVVLVTGTSPSEHTDSSCEDCLHHEAAASRKIFRERASTALQSWLGDCSKLFWIRGKAASGKSTVMKFLRSAVRTHELLDLSSGQPASTVIAEYYFWHPGSRMQKSVEGMYRTILYQILQARPDLLEVACGSRPTGCYTDLRSEGELYNALTSLSRAGQKLLLFVDGLDECNDGTHELLDSLSRVIDLENLKICISSRPWQIFIDEYGAHPSLSLEEVNWIDLESYSVGQLRRYARNTPLYADFHPVLSKDGNRFVHDLVSKAQGVFLWIFLVLRRLEPRMRFAQHLTSLFDTVLVFPRELEVYLRDHVFARINATWNDNPSETAGVLKFCLAGVFEIEAYAPLLTGNAFSDPMFGVNQQAEYRNERECRQRDLNLEVFIHECGADLVRVETRLGFEDSPYSHVVCTHRSVLDFLETEEMQKLLRERTPSHFDMDCRPWRMACLSAMKAMDAKYTSHIFSLDLVAIRAYGILERSCKRCSRSSDVDIIRDCERLILSCFRDNPAALGFYEESSRTIHFSRLCPRFLFWGFDEFVRFVQVHGRFETYDKQFLLSSVLASAFQTSKVDQDVEWEFCKGFESRLRYTLSLGADLNTVHPGRGRTAWHEFLLICSRGCGYDDATRGDNRNALTMEFFIGCSPQQLKVRDLLTEWYLVKLLIELGAYVTDEVCLTNHCCEIDSDSSESKRDEACHRVGIANVLRILVPQQHLPELEDLMAAARSREHVKPA